MQNRVQKAALLVGSLKGRSSTSNSLGTYLTEKLEENGVVSDRIFIGGSLTTDKKRAALLQLVDESDLIILAFPLYIDCLPSRVIETLELIAGYARTKRGFDRKKRNFVAIVNSGFPEARQSETALAVCRIFAKQSGLNWAGGLAMGGGGIISGRPLGGMGGQVRYQKKALELAAEFLARGEAIPEKARILMSKPSIPRWMYLWMGTRGMMQGAKENNAKNDLRNQPFTSIPRV